MTSHNNIIKRTQLVSYGIMAIPIAFAGMPIYIHAPDFYASEYGLSLASMGVVLMALRMFDAIQDPFIGKISDKFIHKASHIICFAGLLLVISFYGLFSPTLIPDDYLLAWFAIMVLLSSTAFSILSINLNTMGGLWKSTQNQKTQITSYREAFGLIGLLLAIVIPAILSQNMSKLQTFNYLAIILAILMLISILFFMKWYFRNSKQDGFLFSSELSEGKNNKFWYKLKNLPKATRNLYYIYFLSVLASSIPALLVLFFIRDLLQAEEYTGLFLLLYFVSGAVFMPLWQYISKRRSKYYAWLTAMIIATASFIWAFTLSAGDLWQYAVICVLSGIAFGADLALPPAILAEHIEINSNQHSSATQFSVLTFLSKFSLAIASILILPLLDMVGFKPDSDNSEQSLAVLSGLYTIMPCLIKLCAILLLWRQLKYFLQFSNNDGSFYEKDYNNNNSRGRSDFYA